MSWATVTTIIVAATSAILIAYDIFVYAGNKERGDTISEVMRKLGKLALIPYAWGMLGGHFYWPGHFLMTRWMSFVIMIGIGLLISGIHYYIAKKFSEPKWFSVLWLLIGIPAGRLFFPM